MLESTVGKQVVVSTVVGPEKLSSEVRRKLLALAPNDRGRHTQMIDFRVLQAKTEIQLVSATNDEPNDLALAWVARNEGANYLLRGEIIEGRGGASDANRQDSLASDSLASDSLSGNSLTISWRLTSLEDGESGGGMPVTVDTKTAIEKYPDLGFLGSRDEVLTTAAVRESFRLLAPSIDREQIQVENAYLLPGSREVRRGNAAAFAGRWGEAQSIWSDVVKRHPTQVPAIHNLALAAAASQDFSRAKEFARRAIRLHPSDFHKQTLVWVETRQRAYHRAFGLADPPEGWFVTRDNEPLPSNEP